MLKELQRHRHGLEKPSEGSTGKIYVGEDAVLELSLLFMIYSLLSQETARQDGNAAVGGIGNLTR